ncbi:TniB family NTP-binding protein [Methylobacterium durans]|nr:TniB family NTP-binding protein [Methylobacterium durans]
MTLTDAEVSERVKTFEHAVVPHEMFKKGQRAVGTLRRRWRPKGVKPLKARALLILGEPGAGKSFILETLRDENPMRVTPDGNIRPVLFVEAPKRTTPRQLAGAIFDALEPGYRLRDGWNTARILSEIRMLCEEMCVEVLMIDEAHHLVDQKNDNDLEDAAEFLKQLLNPFATQIVLAGLPHLGDLPETTKLRQLRRRFRPPFHLEPYNWSDRLGRKKYLGILAFFERHLALPEPSNFTEFDFAARIYCATGGHIGIISGQLSLALEAALSEGKARVDLRLLARIYADLVLRKKPTVLLDFDAPFLGEAAGAPAEPFGGGSPNPADVADAELDASADDNPYLAQGEAFRALWRKMAGARMGDQSRVTAHRTVETPPPSTFGRSA